MRAALLRRHLPICLLAVALVGAGLGASTARAEVLHLSGGHFAGVTPARGVVASRLPGAVARAATVSATPSTSGQLTYGGGPVMHASAPYLIFWAPAGHTVPATTQSLLSRYFTDVAGASGTGANVYGVSRQFYDATGFADYRQTFSSAQVIADSDAYPTRDQTNCPNVSSSYPNCVTDAQLEAEIQHLIALGHLPTDGPASSHTLPAPAPIYFVVLPTDVDVCAAWGSTPSCANSSSNGFCAYHSAFTDTANSTSVLYATIPTLITGSGQNPKACQWDGNTAVQEPNGSAADVVLKYLSHEDSETVTDPFGNAWWDPISGNENGDNCNAYGTVNPAAGTSPNAFAPTLGGSPTGSPFGSLYNQLISGDRYYLQSEWSNGDAACTLRPTPATLSATFTAPATITAPHVAVRLDPSASTSSDGWSSATWNFGDGSATTFNSGGQSLSAVSHVYATDGNYTATLTLVDRRGNVATTSRAIRIDEPPTASFTVSASPGAGQSTQFDATGSSDADGTITSYAWNFGDGNTGSGATPTDTYQLAGTYTVTLSVTDSDGNTATISQTISVAGPLPSFSSGAAVENAPVQFTGAIKDTQTSAKITSYVWNFGDGTTQSGTTLTPSHSYTHFGGYWVTLSATDSNGFTSSVSQWLVVADETPSATFTVTTAAPGSGQPTGFDATASSDPDGTIAAYAWDFGDGTTGTGATPSHTYGAPGTYTVTLTITGSEGETATSTSQVTVAGPLAQFSPPAPQLEGSTLTFTAAAPGPAAVGSVSYSWSVGGTTFATGASATYSFASPGSYPVTLTETDANGDTSSSTQNIRVLDEAPVAAFGVVTTTPSTQHPVALDATASADSDGTITVYTWNFGDGTFATGTTPTTTHPYATAGTYTVTLTVTDSAGQTSAPVSHTFTVYAPPQAMFTIAGNGARETVPLSFDGSTSANPLPGGPIVRFAWSFGDGASATGVTARHPYARPGSYPVTLTATNAVGLSSSITQWVTIGDEAPSALPRVLTGKPLVGSPVAFDGSGSRDSDGHVVGYLWTCGDGTSASGARPTHKYARAGTYTVTLTVVGSGGERASTAISVIVRLPGRITRVQARQGAIGPALIVTVNGPGRLRIGSHSVMVRSAGATHVQLRFSAGQVRALLAHRTVRIRTAIAFTPAAGPPSHRTYTISLRRPVNSRRYTVVLRSQA